MTLKKTDLARRLGARIEGRRKGRGVPPRFAEGSAPDGAAAPPEPSPLLARLLKRAQKT